MKPCQTSLKKSIQEKERKRNEGQGPKSNKAKSPKEASHKEAREPTKHRNLDQSPTKQRAQKRLATRRQGNPLSIET
jgi:hypothetical protein